MTGGAAALNLPATTAASESRHAGAARLVVGATLGNLLSVTPTVTCVFGVFLIPISLEFSWTRAQVAGAFTALSLANAAMFPVAGRLCDRVGTRPVLLIGFILLGLSILGLATLSPSPWQFYGMFALTGAIGALPSNMVIAKLLSEWFDSGRGFWLGLVAGVGNGVGATIMPIIAGALMAAYGWRSAFLAIGAMVLLIGVPVAWFTLRPPRVTSGASELDETSLPGMTAGQALRSPLFWLIFSAVAVGAGCLTAVFANTVPILISHGLSLGQGTAVIAAFAMICTVWEPLVGYLLDRSARPRLVAPFYACAVIGLLLLVHAHGLGLAMLGGVMTGIGLGSEFSVLPYVLSRYFGVRSMGTISGVAYAGVLASTAAAPIGLNLAYDHFNSYAPAVYVVAALAIYATVVFVFLKPYPADYASAAI